MASDSVRWEKVVETRGSVDQGIVRRQEVGSGNRDAEEVIVDSQVLFGGKKEIGIRHEGQLYRLRKTRHGKLILNK